MNYKESCCIPGFSTLFIYFALLTVFSGVLLYKRASQVQPSPKQLSVWSEDLQTIKGKNTPPVDLDLAFMPSEEVIARGKELYQGGTCTGCHGVEGRGDGAAGQYLNPKPRNFHLLEGWTNGPQVAQIFITLTEGIVARGMPAVDTLPVADRFALVHYVRSLGTGHSAPDENEKEVLDKKYELSKGQKEPSQIPVKKAMEIMAKETESQVGSIDKIVAVIEADSSKNHTMAKVLKSSTHNLNLAVKVFMTNRKWREGSSALRDLWMANTNSQGLSSAVVTMSDGQWKALYGYMLDIL